MKPDMLSKVLKERRSFSFDGSSTPYPAAPLLCDARYCTTEHIVLRRVVCCYFFAMRCPVLMYALRCAVLAVYRATACCMHFAVLRQAMLLPGAVGSCRSTSELLRLLYYRSPMLLRTRYAVPTTDML
eukprot:3940665-Rhodomonas_salina.3